MKILTKSFSVITSFSLIAILLASCGASDEKKNMQIVYSVEFPFIHDKTLLKWFPTEYTATFNDHEIYGEMNSKMNVICNRFYADNSDKKVFQTLENMSGKYSCEMSETDVAEFVNDMPDMLISEPIADTVILGVNCKIAMAEFKIDSVPPVKLYYTDEFNFKNSNWYNQYRNLNSFLLGYEVEQFGMRMKLMAKSISKSGIEINPELVFGNRSPESYENKSSDSLRKEIKTMLNDFME